MLADFREVSKKWQIPAYALNANPFDQKYIHEHQNLMARTLSAILTLSGLIAVYPNVRTANFTNTLENIMVWAY